ncbi:MAG: PHP domain-containing protein [Pseudomonadota bacterium]
MRVDLHTHSTASDGSLSPAELVAAAANAGVDILALTDHDTIDGYLGICDVTLPLRLVSGVELTVKWSRRDIHIVGLAFDAADANLTALLARQHKARFERARAIAKRLAQRGMPDMLRAATAAANGQAPGRVHFARCLVDAGVVPTLRRAFRQYLGDGKPCHVRGDWAPLTEAIDCISSAGGVAVLAHPLGYRLTATGLMQLVDDFAAAGGHAVEWSDTLDQAALAKRLHQRISAHDLAVSSGSDYHGDGQPWRRLGRIDKVPDDLRTVYADWRR